MSRPECTAMAEEIRELRRQRSYWVGRLQSATTAEERDGIIATIDGLDNSLQLKEEELFKTGCYLGSGPPVIAKLLEIVHLELTQSTQYYSADGTGAGRDNGVPLVEGKPLLVRVYLRSLLSYGEWVRGIARVGLQPIYAQVRHLAARGRSNAGPQPRSIGYVTPALSH